MKKITAVYKMIVYEDGQIDLEPMPVDYIFDTLEGWDFLAPKLKVSERVKQIMAILDETNDLIHKNAIDLSNPQLFKKTVTLAIKNVASQLQITEQTVQDKATRQLGGISKDQFVTLVFDFFNGGYSDTTLYVSDLYQQLIKHLSGEHDQDYLEKILKKIN